VASRALAVCPRSVPSQCALAVCPRSVPSQCALAVCLAVDVERTENGGRRTEDGGQDACGAGSLMTVYRKALELEPNDPEVSTTPVCVLLHLLEGSQKPLGPGLYMRICDR
jgi:hypothetical protein